MRCQHGDEPLVTDEEEMLIACKDEEISVVAATSIFMRLDLNRTLRGFRSYRVRIFDR